MSFNAMSSKYLAIILNCFTYKRYHSGSLAFGAAIIAIVQLIRITLEYIDRKLKGTYLKISDSQFQFLMCFYSVLRVLTNCDVNLELS